MTIVTRIDEHIARDVVGALQELLVVAQRNQLRGLCFIYKTGPRRHRYGMVGDYRVDPYQALAAVTRMEYKCNQLISDQDDERRTDFTPL